MIPRSKHYHLLTKSFIRAITYRSEMGLWFVLDAIPLVILLFVWQSIYAYQGVQSLSGFSLDQVTQYYFLVLVINAVTASHFESHQVQRIRLGQIDYFLARPLNYLSMIFFESLGGKLLYTAWTIIASIVLFSLLTMVLPLTIPVVTWQMLLAFILLIITGYLIEFFFGLLIVLAGFWFEYAEGLEHFKWVVVSLFSGSMFPPAMLPKWLGSIVEWLPLKYIYAVPIGVIQGTNSFSWGDAAYISGFIAFLWVGSLLIWKQAAYQYASAGG